MSYISFTKPGVQRGPHEHVDQADLFCFIGPSTFNIRLWDNRPDSPTYNHMMSLFVGIDDPKAVVVPKGVVHGYKNVGRVRRHGDQLSEPTLHGRRQEGTDRRDPPRRRPEYYLSNGVTVKIRGRSERVNESEKVRFSVYFFLLTLLDLPHFLFTVTCSLTLS